MKNLCLLLAAFSAISALADQKVYTTKLENGWEDWSWAKVQRAGKTITVRTKKWEGLYFHHAAQKASLFKAVVLTVSGGKAGGQTLQVVATIKGKAVKASRLAPLTPGKATKITVPFVKLGLQDQQFDGFWVQAESDTTYTVQDVALLTK